MNSYDYYGWEVSAKDTMYHRLLREKKNITFADIEPMSKIIKEHIPYPRTALDIGCHYGFLPNSLHQNLTTFMHLILIMIFIISLRKIWKSLKSKI